jgi:hypothetical protein
MRTAVGLAECLEDDFLLMPGNTDTGVVHRERQVVGVLRGHAQHHRALCGEFERVGEQVLEDLAEPLRVRVDSGGYAGFQLETQCQFFL